ncbi:hypothetical protein [Candidatus Flexifilum breve]|uniref:hypothetical protein n=1 Tax=Candidatus Flexifilum breve TaxID=3140694 RepID=UPI0031CCC03B
MPTEDVNALADAIVRTVAAPPDTTRAQQLMLDRFGIDRLVMDLDQLYRGILAKKGKL